MINKKFPFQFNMAYVRRNNFIDSFKTFTFFMKYLFPTVLLLAFTFASCSTTEKNLQPSDSYRPSFSTEPITIAESIEENPGSAEYYRWIDDSEHDDIYKMADEFPNLKNGLRAFQMDLVRTLLLDPDQSCQEYSGERIIVEFVVSKIGKVNQTQLTGANNNACYEIIQDKVKQLDFTPGSVNGEPVPVLYNIPINIQL